MLPMLLLAAKVAAPINKDRRQFLLGAVGIRNDGVIVSARNGCPTEPEPASHAEVRCCKKMDHGGILYVARVSRKDGGLVMARPCPTCLANLRSRKIKKVYYSISNVEYGVLEPMSYVERRVIKN